MNSRKKDYTEYVLQVFRNFENVITIILSSLIGIIIIISLLRVFHQFYTLFIGDLSSGESLDFSDYQELFGKIMTLLISLEFLSSVLRVLKSHAVKTLVLDVSLITALAITRKLIIYDYDHHDPIATITLGGILVCIGIFYFLIKYAQQSSVQAENSESIDS